MKRKCILSIAAFALSTFAVAGAARGQSLNYIYYASSSPSAGNLNPSSITRLGGYATSLGNLGTNSVPKASDTFNWLLANATKFGYSASDMSSLSLRNSFTDNTGILHVAYQQQSGGSDVNRATLEMFVKPNGSIMALSGRLAKGISGTTTSVTDPTPLTGTVSGPTVNADYRALDVKAESPKYGSFTLQRDGYDLKASPMGWQTTPVGDPTTAQYLQGNNVRVDVNVAPTSIGADGRLTYDYTYNTNLGFTSGTNQLAAAVNTFHFANKLHDTFYRFGFDENAGAMQQTGSHGQTIGDRMRFQVDNTTITATYVHSTDIVLGLDSRRPETSYGISNGIIAHEYTHAVMMRLQGTAWDRTGYQGVPGPSDWARSIGEGNSDFFALMLTQQGANQPNTVRNFDDWGTPTRSSGETTAGIRYWSYTYDYNLSSKSMSYLFTDPYNYQYRGGDKWGQLLWDLNKVFIDKYGYTDDLSQGFDPSAGIGLEGNARLFKLVMTANDLLPEDFGWFDARNALLTADAMLFDSADEEMMWNAFARRGWGNSAYLAGTQVYDGFDLPAVLPVPEPGILSLLTFTATCFLMRRRKEMLRERSLMPRS